MLFCDIIGTYGWILEDPLRCGHLEDTMCQYMVGIWHPIQTQGIMCFPRPQTTPFIFMVELEVHGDLFIVFICFLAHKLLTAREIPLQFSGEYFFEFITL